MSGDELHNSKPNGNGTEHVREFFTKWIEGLEHLLEERDRRYDARFSAQETAVDAALTAQKELNRIVSDASEKAIQKAETAQKDYNQRSNEFRGALDDQAKAMARDMLSRIEFSGSHSALIDKVEQESVKYDEKIDDLKKEVALLREAKSSGEARLSEKSSVRSQANWTIGIIIAVAMSLLSLIFGVAEFIIANGK